MTREERNKLVEIVRTHLSSIDSLVFGQYDQAQFLCSRTLKLLSEHFPERKVEYQDVAKLNFRSISQETAALKVTWDVSKGTLKANAYTMWDDLVMDKSSSGPTLTRKICATFFLLAFSLVLWSSNGWLKCQWLVALPKRTQFCVSTQLGIVLLFGLMLTHNRTIKFIELAGLLLAIAAFISSFL